MANERAIAYKASLKDAKALVVGLGKSGKAAVSALNTLGAKVSVQDSATEDKFDKEYIEYLDANNVGKFLGSNPDDCSIFDMMVLSPGVPTDLAWITEAKDAGVEIIGELELAYRLSSAKYVALTGTNGKTTTTTLVGEIFEAANRNTSVVGNIGNAVVTAAIDSNDDDWMVAEVSSFQLETTKEFKPEVSAILNLTPDHLNRHKTMAAYGEAKAKIFANQTEENYLVVNFDDESVMELASDCKAKLVPFSRKKELEFGAFLSGDELVLRNEEGETLLICKASELKIIGDHNIENALAAAALSYFAGIDMAVITKAIVEFPGVEHRIEFCGTVNDVLYYNDSKGTNVDAAVIALKALKSDIILIAGGDGKAQDFTDLATELDGKVKALILLGRDADQIEKCAKDAGFSNIYKQNDMEGCVSKASEIAVCGDKVLLSPACASWDMYKSYEHRGRHFKECVAKLCK